MTVIPGPRLKLSLIANENSTRKSVLRIRQIGLHLVPLKIRVVNGGSYECQIQGAFQNSKN